MDVVSVRSRALFAVVPLAALVLTGCADGSDPAPTASGSAAATKKSSVATVAGYDVGQFPPVPLFRIPDLSLVDAAQSQLAKAFQANLGTDYPGLTVENAHCDSSGAVIGGDGAGDLYGGASQVNGGDGSGVLSAPGVSVVNGGDGSGVFSGGGVSIVSDGTGGGTYSGDGIDIVVQEDGSGTYSDGRASTVNGGDGSGTHSDGRIAIVNGGDGSGTYSDGSISIINDGKGTARVNGTTVKADPIPPVAKLGGFPAFTALEPAKVCGTSIRVSDDVLFDFDSSTLRPEADATMDSLAKAFGELGVKAASITGNTDSIGSPSYNKTLSEKRAAAVVKALTDRGVGGALSAAGNGADLPVAANEIDGKDNPAGRQLNRRVDIVIPAS